MGKMVNPYLERRNGREKVTYPHPCLEPILKRTLGIPLFQEQLIRMAMTAADFTGGQAEELRRAMGFKRSEERMVRIEKELRAGMTNKGIATDAQDQILKGIQSFALYGFPESHAASFALIAYASAYLKAHHGAAFLCAMLNNHPLGFYHPSTLIADARRHGIPTLPVDIAHSQWPCTLEPHPENPGHLAVRLGLKYIHGLRKEVGERIAIEREKQRFWSLGDFHRRCQPNKNETAVLAEAGAFGSFGTRRRDAIWQAEALGKSGPLFSVTNPDAPAYLDHTTSNPANGDLLAIKEKHQAKHKENLQATHPDKPRAPPLKPMTPKKKCFQKSTTRVFVPRVIP